MNYLWDFSFWTLFWTSTQVLAVCSIPSVLLQRRGRPQAAIAWVLALFALPWLGLLLWWLVGRRHLRRVKRRRKITSGRISKSLETLRQALPSPPEPNWSLARLVRFPRTDADWVFPATIGNSLRLLVDAKEAYPAMIEDIECAREHIHFMFYIWREDKTGSQFRDLLLKKVRQGVEVRVLYDAWGALLMRAKFMAPLRDAGAEVAVFAPPKLFSLRPVWNFRNHRKILVVDGRVGIVGGLNIGDEYMGWRDLAVRVSGSAVDQLQEVFADDWFFATGKELADPGYFGRWQSNSPDNNDHRDAVCGVVASGPHTDHNWTHDAFFTAITSAEKRIWIITPYFIPDQTILTALRTAVYRGVDVRVLVPGEKVDRPLVRLASRSYYPYLLESGVRIFEYREGMIHTKAAIFDDDVSVVGSANVDIRSFRLNFEISCFMQSVGLTEQLSALFVAHAADSDEILLRDVERSSVLMKVAESAVHLLSPML